MTSKILSKIFSVTSVCSVVDNSTACPVVNNPQRAQWLIERTLVLCLMVVGWVCACAQEAPKDRRPIQSAYMIEWGSARLADTYLTPLTYNGDHFEFQYERTQFMGFAPDKWMCQLALDLRGDHTENPAHNATMLNAMIDGRWGMTRYWQLPANVKLGAGPSISLGGGALYLSRNGNNPASAKLAATVNASAFASWQFKAWRVPVTLRYQTTLPVAGAFFSPNYGQLYYQIYMGDDKGLAHAAWWGNRFEWQNMLTADLRLWRSTSLRIGYHGRILSTKASNLVTHEYSHSLLLGVCVDWRTY